MDESQNRPFTLKDLKLLISSVPVLIMLTMGSLIVIMGTQDNAERENRVDASNFRDIEGVQKTVLNLGAEQNRQVFAAANNANIALGNMTRRAGSGINPDRPLLDQVHLMKVGDYYLLFTTMYHLSKTDLYPYIMALYDSETATIMDYKTFAETVMTAARET